MSDITNISTVKDFNKFLSDSNKDKKSCIFCIKSPDCKPCVQFLDPSIEEWKESCEDDLNIGIMIRPLSFENMPITKQQVSMAFGNPKMPFVVLYDSNSMEIGRYNSNTLGDLNDEIEKLMLNV